MKTDEGLGGKNDGVVDDVGALSIVIPACLYLCVLRKALVVALAMVARKCGAHS